MNNIHGSLNCRPKMAFSDFDFFRIVVDFIGDVATSLNAVLNFINNLLNFGS